VLAATAVAAGLLAAAGCGGGGAGEATTTAPTAAKTSVRVYLLLDGKVQGVRRLVPRSAERADAAYRALVAGPTAAERGLGLATRVPANGTWTLTRSTAGVLALRTGRLARPALAQAVYTLTQFPGPAVVEVNGTRYTRAAFEDETPAVLVESPLAFQRVTSPLRARGTANTFEATFQYDLRAGGKVLKTHFVTATSGTGTRGTFAVEIPFAASGRGTLVVYELSAKDGSRIHEVAIPLVLAG
jgi:hypothetical protein